MLVEWLLSSARDNQGFPVATPYCSNQIAVHRSNELEGDFLGAHGFTLAMIRATAEVFVCHGDDGGPRFHPCRRVQEALRAAGIEYNKVIGGHGSPIPFLRKGSRDALREATGATNLPALKLSDGTVISHSRDILSWVGRQN